MKSGPTGKVPPSRSERLAQLRRMSADGLAEWAERLERRVAVLRDAYGVNGDVPPIPDDKPIVGLLAYYRGSLRQHGYYVDDGDFAKINRLYAEELLSQFPLATLTAFIDWFWVMRPTDRFWSKVPQVDRLKTVAKALNTYLMTVRREERRVQYD